MHIPRLIKEKLISKLTPNKVVVLYGARQVGKTTLTKEILKDVGEPYMFISGEDRDVQEWLGSGSLTTLKRFIGNNKFLIIDEAQQTAEIGLNLKLIVDHIEGIRVLATGSSSFELAHQVGEPLVGRKWQFTLYPISQIELSVSEEMHETKAKLHERLIYGSYPAVLSAPNHQEKTDILKGIVDGTLYRDILQFDEVKKSQKVVDILRLIAFQIGKEVSLSEAGNAVNLDSRTVEKYLDILEKMFIIKRVQGFSRNLRKEITKSSRYYFFDNGVRNELIGNFNEIAKRDDIGQLWENYLFMERLKRNEYKGHTPNVYFWRTWDKKEIDLIEESGGVLAGFEFKWKKGFVSAPDDWLKNYKEATFTTINQENYLEFIG